MITVAERNACIQGLMQSLPPEVAERHDLNRWKYVIRDGVPMGNWERVLYGWIQLVVYSFLAQDDTPEADVIRDAMDDPWYAMSREEGAREHEQAFYKMLSYGRRGDLDEFVDEVLYQCWRSVDEEGIYGLMLTDQDIRFLNRLLDEAKKPAM